MSNNIEKDINIVEEITDNTNSYKRKNRRGKMEVKFEVGSNCYKAIENILNEYKKNQNIVDKIKSKIKELQNICAEIQGTEHEGEIVLYLMEIDLLQKLLKED